GFDGTSFRTMNYLSRIGSIQVRNNVQPMLSSRPVDFSAVRVSKGAMKDAFSDEMEEGIWLHGDDHHQALILRRGNSLRSMPLAELSQDAAGHIQFKRAPWGPGYPLRIWEDDALEVPTDRSAWLDEWHSETEWLRATHKTRYSNAVTSLGE